MYFPPFWNNVYTEEEPKPEHASRTPSAQNYLFRHTYHAYTLKKAKYVAYC